MGRPQGAPAQPAARCAVQASFHQPREPLIQVHVWHATQVFLLQGQEHSSAWLVLLAHMPTRVQQHALLQCVLLALFLQVLVAHHAYSAKQAPIPLFMGFLHAHYAVLGPTPLGWA